MPQLPIRRWINTGVAFACAGALTFGLASNISDTGAGNIARPVTVAPVTPPHTDHTPEVRLTVVSEFLAMWLVLSTVTTGATKVANFISNPPTLGFRSGPLYDVTRGVLPQLLEDGISGYGTALLYDTVRYATSPVSNTLFYGPLGPLLSPLVALGNSISSIAAHSSGDNPSRLGVMGEVIKTPGNVIKGYRNGAELDLSWLTPRLAEAGVLPEGTDPESLRIGFGGRNNMKSVPGLSGAGAGAGALTGLLRDFGSILGSGSANNVPVPPPPGP
jgi:hypothetical protein